MSVVLVTVLSSFIASVVEFVEALTVVLAVGVTRQWRSTFLGVGRYAIAFGRFWYDFLIGHRPELFVGPIVALALVALLIRAGWGPVSGLLFFGLVVASGGLGLARELAAARARSDR